MICAVVDLVKHHFKLYKDKIYSGRRNHDTRI